MPVQKFAHQLVASLAIKANGIAQPTISKKAIIREKAVYEGWLQHARVFVNWKVQQEPYFRLALKTIHSDTIWHTTLSQHTHTPPRGSCSVHTIIPATTAKITAYVRSPMTELSARYPDEDKQALTQMRADSQWPTKSDSQGKMFLANADCLRRSTLCS